MTKWIKLIENQYLGFWSIGIILFILQEIPYMVMPFIKLENNPIMNMPETSMILNIIEKILGSLCIALMIFVIHNDMTLLSIGTGIQKIAFVSMIIILLLNYFGWMLYFKGYQSVVVMMLFIVFLPPLYYVCIGVWRENWILVYTGITFFFIHSIHTFKNLNAMN